MRIVLTKLSDRSHVFEVFRDDGSTERAELETRSMLVHDLVHYAVEAELGLHGAFYGSLAAGSRMASLRDETILAADNELALAERLVGPMQSLYRGHTSRAAYLEHGSARHPELVNEPFVDAILERLRQLVGRWRATRYGSAMELAWPPPETGPPGS